MSYIHGSKQKADTPPSSPSESSGSSDDAEAKKGRGNRLFAKKKYPKAVKYYTKAIKIEPNNHVYYLNRAVANSALELWNYVEEDAAQALQLSDPPTVKCHFHSARAKLRRGRAEDARKAVQAGLSAYPDDKTLTALEKEIAAKLSKLEEKQRRESEAVAARAAEPKAPLGPSAAKTLHEKAQACYAAGRLEEAIGLLKQACDSMKLSDSASLDAADLRTAMGALSLMGKASMQLRRFEDAVEAFDKLLRLQEATLTEDTKDNCEALSNSYNNFGIALKNAGRRAEAIEAMSKAYQKATNGDDKVATSQAGQILQNVAQCYRASGNHEEALRFSGRALDIGLRIYDSDHASHALGYLSVARCQRDMGDIREAIQSYTRALEIWMKKDAETCLQEMPEVPNQERLVALQQQTRQELAQILAGAQAAMQNQAAASPVVEPQGA